MQLWLCVNLCSLAGDLNEFKTKAHQTIQSVLDSHDSSSLSEWHRTVFGKRRGGSAVSVNIETSYRRTKDSTVEQQSSMTDVGSVVQEANIPSAAENESLDERTREFLGKAEACNTGSTVAFRSGFHGDVSEHRQSDDADQSMNRHGDDSSLDGARGRNLEEVRGGSYGNRGHVDCRGHCDLSAGADGPSGDHGGPGSYEADAGRRGRGFHLLPSVGILQPHLGVHGHYHTVQCYL